MEGMNIKNLIFTQTGSKLIENLEGVGTIKIVSKLDDILEERGLDYQKLSKISGVRNNTISEIAKCKKGKISLVHIVSLMVALRLTDIRDIIDVEYEDKTKNAFNKERVKWEK